MRIGKPVIAVLLIAAATVGAALLALHLGAEDDDGGAVPMPDGAIGFTEEDEARLVANAGLRYAPQDMIAYEQTRLLRTDFDEPRAVLVDEAGFILVAGDRVVRAYGTDDSIAAEVACAGDVRAITFEGEGPQRRLWAASDDLVEQFHRNGTRLDAWKIAGLRLPQITSIAVHEDTVYLADAANRRVLACEKTGDIRWEVGQRDPDRAVPGIILRSAYFDVAVSPDRLVWVGNAGRGQMESYTRRGTFDRTWGVMGTDIDKFFPCCNPSNFALFPDGRFVTAEKGVLRVKVCDVDGTCASVVADAHLFEPHRREMQDRAAERLVALDVAVDAQQRVYILDMATGLVHVMQENSSD